jgi:hypothetical protein
MKVPRQCPLVLLVKVRHSAVKMVEMKGGERREVERGYTALNYNPRSDIKPWD